MRVLVVDDNPIACIMIKEMLAARGHEVVAQAGNKAEALSAFIAQKPDFVTLDLSLGEDNGFAVLIAIREVDPQAKVVVVSGNPQKGIREKAIGHGAVGVIMKPFKIEELQAAVDGAFKLGTQ